MDNRPGIPLHFDAGRATYTDMYCLCNANGLTVWDWLRRRRTAPAAQSVIRGMPSNQELHQQASGQN